MTLACQRAGRRVAALSRTSASLRRPTGGRRARRGSGRSAARRRLPRSTAVARNARAASTTQQAHRWTQNRLVLHRRRHCHRPSAQRSRRLTAKDANRSRSRRRSRRSNGMPPALRHRRRSVRPWQLPSAAARKSSSRLRGGRYNRTRPRRAHAQPCSVLLSGQMSQWKVLPPLWTPREAPPLRRGLRAHGRAHEARRARPRPAAQMAPRRRNPRRVVIPTPTACLRLAMVATVATLPGEPEATSIAT